MQSFNQAREEIDSEKVRAEAAASILAKKTKAMQEQVQLLCPIKKKSLKKNLSILWSLSVALIYPEKKLFDFD